MMTPRTPVSSPAASVDVQVLQANRDTNLHRLSERAVAGWHYQCVRDQSEKFRELECPCGSSTCQCHDRWLMRARGARVVMAKRHSGTPVQKRQKGRETLIQST